MPTTGRRDSFQVSLFRNARQIMILQVTLKSSRMLTKPAITQVTYLLLLQETPTTFTKQSCLQTALFCVHYPRTFKKLKIERHLHSIFFILLFGLH